LFKSLELLWYSTGLPDGVIEAIIVLKSMGQDNERINLACPDPLERMIVGYYAISNKILKGVKLWAKASYVALKKAALALFWGLVLTFIGSTKY